MIRSMTGFGEAERAYLRYRVAAMARSVNHRFLDVSLRLPEELRQLEPELRQMALAAVSRGRVELRVEFETLTAGGAQLEVEREGLAQLASAAQELIAAGIVERGFSAGDLLRLPELVRVRREPQSWEEGDTALVREATRGALAALGAVREQEGAQLEKVLRERLERLEALLAVLADRRLAVREETASSLRRRLHELLDDSSIPEDRLTAEAALLAERSDVQEELDRTQAHLHHCRAVLEEGGPVGRRLDFLAQEIQRELNTLGAKCRDVTMAETNVEAKVVCEQLREQVQNVE